MKKVGMMACVTLLACLCIQSEGTSQGAKSPPMKAETSAPEFMVVGEVRDNVLRGFAYNQLRPVQLPLDQWRFYTWEGKALTEAETKSKVKPDLMCIYAPDGKIPSRAFLAVIAKDAIIVARNRP
jgi:hypothetical protein